MTVKDAALKVLNKYKGMQIIEALPGDNKFIFCLKPKGYEGTIMDSYYYCDNKGNVGEYAYGLHMDEWRSGMKNKIDISKV